MNYQLRKSQSLKMPKELHFTLNQGITVGVFPSVKKKEYCEEHGIPYVEGNSLKGLSFEGKVMIEEIVYNEYCVISV